MCVDASKSGYGILITNLEFQQQIQGEWHKEEKYHINVKETLAILYELQSLPETFHNSIIQISSGQ